jgi:hypothetical protein
VTAATDQVTAVHEEVVVPTEKTAVLPPLAFVYIKNAHFMPHKLCIAHTRVGAMASIIHYLFSRKLMGFLKSTG